jgi:hypothetical protein
MPTFVLNNETILTAHGFVLLNSGGKFDRFRENPVMLDSHNNESGMAVIGRWDNLRIEGPKLMADSVFDTDDPEAMKISGKVDRGFIKGASMGVIPIDAEMRDVPGLGYVVALTAWEMLEASPVGVPSNKAALRLYAPDGKTPIEASEIKLSIQNLIKNPTMEKINLSVEAAKVLNLSRDPESSELNAAIMELSAKLSAANAAKTAAETAKADAVKALGDHLTLQATEMVDTAIKEGRLTADKKESFVKLAVTDFKQAKDLIDAMPVKQNLSGQVRPADGGSPAPSREGWDYMKYLKEAPQELKAMEVNDPDGFAKLKANYKRA